MLKLNLVIKGAKPACYQSVCRQSRSETSLPDFSALKSLNNLWEQVTLSSLYGKCVSPSSAVQKLKYYQMQETRCTQVISNAHACDIHTHNSELNMFVFFHTYMYMFDSLQDLISYTNFFKSVRDNRLYLYVNKEHGSSTLS